MIKYNNHVYNIQVWLTINIFFYLKVSRTGIQILCLKNELALFVKTIKQNKLFQSVHLYFVFLNILHGVYVCVTLCLRINFQCVLTKSQSLVYVIHS